MVNSLETFNRLSLRAKEMFWTCGSVLKSTKATIAHIIRYYLGREKYKREDEKWNLENFRIITMNVWTSKYVLIERQAPFHESFPRMIQITRKARETPPMEVKPSTTRESTDLV